MIAIIPILKAGEILDNVSSDRTRIIQVIVNILENAVEFTDRGTITLRLNENMTTREILLTISDSGRGIDPEILPNLFTKFVSKSRKGTGLGLYISKKLIETHGGKIWAENCYDENNKIEGSKFTLTLPSKDNEELHNYIIIRKLWLTNKKICSYRTLLKPNLGNFAKESNELTQSVGRYFFYLLLFE